MPVTDCLKSKPNKVVIFKGTSYMFKRKHVHQGFAGFQALSIVFATSGVQPAVSGLLQWAIPWVQIPGQKVVHRVLQWSSSVQSQ